MKVSTKGRYALRFMIDLAEHQGEGAVTLKEVSARQDVSVKYLEQIVTQLNRAGLIRSVRGNQGGYLLTKPVRQYTAGEILECVEGTLYPVACMEQSPNVCGRAQICKTIRFWNGLYEAIQEYVNKYTLEDLIQDCGPQDGSDYCI